MQNRGISRFPNFWTPRINDVNDHDCVFVFSEKPCALYCTPVGRDAPVLMAERVLDGTPCGPYESDLCVHGRCQVLYFSIFFCFVCLLYNS